MKSYDQRTGVTPKPNEDEVEGQIVLKKIEHFFSAAKNHTHSGKKTRVSEQEPKTGQNNKKLLSNFENHQQLCFPPKDVLRAAVASLASLFPPHKE
jgi:hypothetical protein